MTLAVCGDCYGACHQVVCRGCGGRCRGVV